MIKNAAGVLQQHFIHYIIKSIPKEVISNGHQSHDKPNLSLNPT